MDNNQLMYDFGKIINAMGGGGDFCQVFPESDTNDFSNGARYVPGQVTLARRRGEIVTFDPYEHEWTMPNGDVVR